MYAKGERVYVCRTKGGWSEAVVHGVDADKEEYTILFSDAQSRTVRKVLSFKAAEVHLRRSGPTQAEAAVLLLPHAAQRQVEGLCKALVAEPDAEFSDVATKYAAAHRSAGAAHASSASAGMLAPHAAQQLDSFVPEIESLLRHLQEQHLHRLRGSDARSVYELVSEWCEPHLPRQSAAPPPPPPVVLAVPGSNDGALAAAHAVSSVDEVSDIEASRGQSPCTPELSAASAAGENSPVAGGCAVSDDGADATGAAASGVDWELVLSLVASMTELRESAAALAKVGSPSDNDIERREDAMAEYDEKKHDLAELVLAGFRDNGGKPLELPDYVEDGVVAMLSGVFEEGDQRAHASALVGAFLSKTTTATASCYGDMIEANNLLVNACTDGNVEFLSHLLHWAYTGSNKTLLPSLCLSELLAAASFSQSARIPLVHKVLDTVPASDYTSLGEDGLEEASSVLGEFLLSICDPKKAHAKESRAAYKDAVVLALSQAAIPLKEDDLAQLYVVCCSSGDEAVYKLLERNYPTAVEPSRDLEDGRTPLILAAMYGHTEVLRRMLAHPSCDVDHVAKLGTALGFAENLHKQDAVELLQKAGAEVSEFHME